MYPIERVLRAVRQYPQRPALVARGQVYTYEQFFRYVTAVRQEIRRQESNLGHQERIGLCTADDVWTYAAIIALMCERSAYVPLNRKSPEARNLSIVEDAELKVVFMSDRTPEFDQLQRASPDMRSVVEMARLTLPDAIENQFFEEHEPTNLTYLLFTSGSTGRPKGVPIHQAQLKAFVDAVVDGGVYDFRPDDRFLQMFELTFDLSIFSYLIPLCVGACVVAVPESGIGHLKVYETLEDEQITVALMVPSVLAHLQSYFPEIELLNLRWSLFCGEALPHSLAAQWANCVPRAHIENVYGPTEATIFCTRYRFHEAQSRLEQVQGVVPIGKALAGLELCVLPTNGSLHPLPEGSQGELALIGPQVTTGYWHLPERTAAQFVPLDWKGTHRMAYRTGDLAKVNPHGNYVYLGRTDNQVKIEGYRVELGEIEHHVRLFTRHGLCAVVPMPTESGGTILHLFVEPFDGATGRLMEHLRQQLPVYMVPRHLHLLDNLPLSLAGKVDRPALKLMTADAVAVSQAT
jgi:D-alanine--poly(phosphoribitol) ligase subunit 1